MIKFEQTASHPLVARLQEKMAEPEFKKAQRELFQTLPKDFDAEHSVLFSTPGEDYLEWIDIIEAVYAAKDRFVMFELGAGYGRWCMNALHALKCFNPLPFHFVAVEAETLHFRFLKEYFTAHGLNLDDHRLIEAAIDTQAGEAVFHMGDPNEWYGQYIDGEKPTLLNKIIYGLKNTLLSNQKTDRRKVVVKTITLNSLLVDYERVDLIDMDIQSSELGVLKASIDLLNQKVKRLHVGTHSKEIDEGLKNLFCEHGWKNVHLFPSFSTCTTPYGMVVFNDGIQSWINPMLA